MLPTLHLLCMIVALPYVVLATGFMFLGQAIQRHSLWGFLDSLLEDAAWLVSWGGLLVVASYLTVIAMAFFQQTRLYGVIAGFSVCLFAVVGIVALSSTRMAFGQWLFLTPCLVALGVEAFLVFNARPVRV